jgi:hypothetical protein
MPSWGAVEEEQIVDLEKVPGHVHRLADDDRNEPKRRCMSGSCFLESSWMERCGSALMRLKLPMTGHGVRPGERLYNWPDLALSLRRMVKKALPRWLALVVSTPPTWI